MPSPNRKEVTEAGGGGMPGKAISSARSPSLYDAIRSASNARTARMQSQGQNPSSELARNIGKSSMYYKGDK